MDNTLKINLVKGLTDGNPSDKLEQSRRAKRGGKALDLI